jgi:hypothetical protein
LASASPPTPSRKLSPDLVVPRGKKLRRLSESRCSSWSCKRRIRTPETQNVSILELHRLHPACHRAEGHARGYRNGVDQGGRGARRCAAQCSYLFANRRATWMKVLFHDGIALAGRTSLELTHGLHWPGIQTTQRNAVGYRNTSGLGAQPGLAGVGAGGAVKWLKTL